MALIVEIEQGSPEWEQARCGCITMSHAIELMTGGKGVTRRNYLLDVASEILSGKPVERYQSADMALGLELEKFAAEAYVAETGVQLGRAIGFAYLDERKRIGGSPDGIVRLGSSGHGVEIKCPRPRQHMRYIVGQNHYGPQMQGLMWVFDADSWDFVSFCPDFESCPLLIVSQKRSQDFITKLAESCERGIEEIDAFVEKVRGVEYAHPEAVAAVTKRAKRHMETLLAEESEVRL